MNELKNNPKVRFSAAARDLVILGLIITAVFTLSYSFNVFNFLVKIFENNPQTIVYIDEIITILLTLSAGLAIYSWRRWLELKKESADRIKNQEMLREAAETKAEVERIISKQLRTDMDQVKQEIKEILYILGNKRKQ
jgi:hypothetical protein